MASPLRPLLWVGPVLETLRGLPADARQRVGYELHRVQEGLAPGDWRPMPSVGGGVVEIRVHTTLEVRVLYIARFREGIYVLHAFEKRSQKTRQHDIGVGRASLAAVLQYRRTLGRS